MYHIVYTLVLLICVIKMCSKIIVHILNKTKSNVDILSITNFIKIAIRWQILGYICLASISKSEPIEFIITPAV